jgi:hypothetical protein
MVYSTQTERKIVTMTDHSLRLFNLKTYPWIFLAFCMLAGTLVGMLSSYMIKPIYEAQATLTANMEIVRNYPITEIMVDSQMTVIGNQVYDSQVVEDVLRSENSIGQDLNFEDFRTNTSFERQMMNTVLKYRYHDPIIAQRVVNTWARIFHDRLLEAYPYGLAVSAARDTLQQIGKCKTDPIAQKADFCLTLEPGVEAELKNDANAVILNNSPLSLGLTSALTISNVIPADIPDAPLRFARGNLILAGMFIGLVVGALFIESAPACKETDA